jgi:hypothetical protein
MNPRTLYIAFFEDLAKRHADIRHVAGSKATQRFFLELDYGKLMGATEPSNLGWNLVLMGFETVMDDNRHGSRMEKVVCLFDVLKHVKAAADGPMLQAVYDQAREIGEELLIRAREMQDNPCAAIAAGHVSEDVEIPYSFRFGGKRTIEVGPRWDNFFGYRFQLDLLIADGVKKASTDAKWITPA